MNDKIVTFIKEEISLVPLDSIDIHEDLFGSGIVDSLGMMKLVVFLEKEFEVNIAPEDMTVENFDTVHHISEYLSKTKD